MITQYKTKDIQSDSLVAKLNSLQNNKKPKTEGTRAHSPDRLRRIEILNGILLMANVGENLDEILNNTLDNSLSLLNSSIGGILLVGKDGGTLTYRVSRGLVTERVDKTLIPFGSGVLGKAAATGECILINDILQDSPKLDQAFKGVRQLRACIAIPIQRKQEVVGVIAIGNTEAGKYDDKDIPILNAIGDSVAGAIVRLRVDAKIKKGMERYQALMKYALNVQEDERKRLARELHDETSQALTSLTFRLQAVIQMAEMNGYSDVKFKESLQKAHSSAIQAGKEIVRLMKDLRPAMLDDLGMPTAIYDFAKDHLEPKGTKVTMRCIGAEHRLPTEVEVTFFRVAQGLISNIMKHSRAKNVSILVEITADKASLHIEDDGIGFDIKKITGIEPNGRGAGLLTMKERLRFVGGTGRIESEPGKGTRITVTVPVVRKLEDLVHE